MKKQVSEVTDKEAILQYADWLASKSIFLDESGTQDSIFLAQSNRTSSLEKLRRDFPVFARETGIWIASDGYHDFLETLPKRLPFKMVRVLGTGFKPVPESHYEDSFGARLANKFIPPNHPPLQGDFSLPDILKQYLDRVLANKQDQKYVVQWLADILQNPTKRPQWGLILTGDPGCGKSRVHRIMELALGGRHIWEGKYTDAFKQFSEVLPDNLLVTFDDKISDKNTCEKLKSGITCSSMQIELKGVQNLVHRDVYARVLILSNLQAPLKGLPPDWRRSYVTERSQHRESPEETAAFFVGFNKWLDDDATPAILYHWLMSVDLSDFSRGSTIQTEAQIAMVGASASVLDTLLADYVANESIFSDNMLLSYLAENNCNKPNPDLIKSCMEQLDYFRKRRTVKGCGTSQHQIWQKGTKRGRAITDDEAAAIKDAAHIVF